MATTNLNLNTLAGTEKLKSFPTPYNDNMDAIDDAFGSGFGVGNNSSVDDELNGLGNGMAIIANGNTHAAITSGQYVYVRQHGSLSEGLYKATANISANGTLSGSNLTAVSSGGLNELNSNISTVTQLTASFASDVSVSSSSHIFAYKYMKMLLITGYINPNSNIPASKTIATVSGVNTIQETFDSPNSSGGGTARMKISNSGQKVYIITETQLTASQWYSFTFVTFLS